MTGNRQPKKPVEYSVEMAVAALDCHPRPSPMDDPDMRHVDPSPVSLDLTRIRRLMCTVPCLIR